jgi:hypothetical protein
MPAVRQTRYAAMAAVAASSIALNEEKEGMGMGEECCCAPGLSTWVNKFSNTLYQIDISCHVVGELSGSRVRMPRRGHWAAAVAGSRAVCMRLGMGFRNKETPG